MNATGCVTTPAWIPDHSAVACFRENPEAFRLKYRLHLSPATPDDKIRAGSAIHAARNVLFTGGDTETAVAAARAVRGESGVWRNADHVERVVRAYAARYPRELEPFSVVESEQYGEARIQEHSCGCGFGVPHRDDCNGFTFCGILDAVIRFADGSEYVCDLKSTGAYLNTQWETAMGLSDQFVGYVALRRALGHRCDGFYVDGVHMSDPKPRKDGSLGEARVNAESDFVRFGPVRVPQWRIDRWARNMRYTLAQIAWLEREWGVDSPWPLYQNWSFGKVDAYREFYESPAELHNEVAQLFERKPWSPAEVAAERAEVTQK